jgi:hypothetical protein
MNRIVLLRLAFISAVRGVFAIRIPALPIRRTGFCDTDIAGGIISEVMAIVPRAQRSKPLGLMRLQNRGPLTPLATGPRFCEAALMCCIASGERSRSIVDGLIGQGPEIRQHGRRPRRIHHPLGRQDAGEILRETGR